MKLHQQTIRVISALTSGYALMNIRCCTSLLPCSAAVRLQLLRMFMNVLFW